MISLSSLISSEHQKVALQAIVHNQISIIDQQQLDGGILYKFMVPSFTVTRNLYTPYIFIQKADDEKITRQTQCQVFCNCENFKYGYSAYLHIHKGLYNYIPEKPVLPKNQHKGCCKHITAAILYLLRS